MLELLIFLDVIALVVHLSEYLVKAGGCLLVLLLVVGVFILVITLIACL